MKIIKKNNFLMFLFGTIFIIAFILRFYKLGEVPYGFYQDESAIGYNAYSLLQTGRDEYGEWFPLYFKSFGDYKLPVYIYSTLASISIFGVNEFAVRFPSALFSFLTVVLLYFYIRDVSKNRTLALLSSFFLAINPWHIHYGRATFEVSICLFLFVAGAYLLHLAFTSKKPLGLFFLGTLCFVISLYGYNLTRLLAPLLYTLLLLYYFKEIKTYDRKEIVLTGIIGVLMLFPFVKTFFESGGASSASGTLIFSSNAVYAPLLEFRSYLVNLPNTFSILFFNKWIMILWQYLKNIISYLSVDFFFLSGSLHGNHGIGTVGQFYLFDIVFFISGAFGLIRKKVRWGLLLFIWALLTVLVASITREAPHATRSFFLIIPLVVVSAFGLLEIFNFIKLYKASRVVKYSIFVGLSLVALYNIVYYLTSYYVRFPIAYAKAWRAEDKKLSEYIKMYEKEYDTIIIDDDSGFIYTSYLFYSLYPPSDFQATVRRLPDDKEGFSKVESFGKFEFRKIDWQNDLIKSKVLIITKEQNKPKNVSSLAIFSYPVKPVVLSVGEEIMYYPVEELAYVLVKTQ